MIFFTLPLLGMSNKGDRYEKHKFSIRCLIIKKYGELKQAFIDDNNFWRLGHSFNTVLDYFAIIDDHDSEDFIAIAQKKYTELEGDWYDDFGWWGISHLRASSMENAMDCWQKMTDGATKVWTNADHKIYGLYGPMFYNGLWNANWDENCNPINPSNALKGIQNTVTNGLYLVLSGMLYESTGEDVYFAGAKSVCDFLRQWFDFAPIDEQALLWDLGDKGIVIRERVSMYVSQEQVNAYRPSLIWAGDQGLILGGMLSYIKMEPDGRHDFIKFAKKLILGSKNYLFDQNFTMLPWNEQDGLGSPGGDDTDYWTGIAVWSRYLLKAYMYDRKIRSYIKKIEYDKLIMKNANQIIYNQYRQQSGNKLVDLTNDLAVLLLAYFMMDK